MPVVFGVGGDGDVCDDATSDESFDLEGGPWRDSELPAAGRTPSRGRSGKERFHRLGRVPVERYQVTVADVLGGHLIPRSQRVTPPDSQDPALAQENWPDGDVVALYREPRRHEIDLALQQRSERIVEPRFPELHVTAGMTLLERFDDRREVGAARGEEGQAQSQCSFQVVIGGSGPLQDVNELLVCGHGISQEPLTERRQGDAPACPVQELVTKLALERPQGLAHPRGGESEPFCTPTEVKLVSQREEDPKLAQLDPSALQRQGEAAHTSSRGTRSIGSHPARRTSPQPR